MKELSFIETRISYVVYHEVSDFSATGNKYLIAQCEPVASIPKDNKQTTVTVCGEMRDPKLYRLYRFYGKWTPSTNPKYKDQQFKFYSYEPVIELTAESISLYLSDHIPLIGPRTADKIVDHFGLTILDDLRSNPCHIKSMDALPLDRQDSIIEYFNQKENII